MKIHFYAERKIWWQSGLMMIFIILSFSMGYAQPSVTNPATGSFPVGVGKLCSGGSNSVRVFKYDGISMTLSEFETCYPDLQSPGFAITGAGISYNPGDHMLYYYRYTNKNTYVWRWTPGSGCPPKTALFDTYVNQAILGFAFDPNGLCYQLIFTGSSPYGLALRTVDFSTGTFGPQKNISLPSGVSITQQSGDLTLSPDGRMLMVWDKKYLTVNYEDYATPNPLKATLITTLSGNQIVGLNFAEGKLIAADNGNKYWDLNILTGAKTAITQTPCYQSNDLTEIISGIGAAKKLSSAIPTGTPGVYDLSYDIFVKNYGGWDVTDVQVVELLKGTATSGAPFLSLPSTNTITNVTVTLIDNPAGVVLNPGYTGLSTSGGAANLLASGQVLRNSPVAENHFTVRVSFRVTGIVIGKVYNNNAKIKGTGYAGLTIEDVSTNGDNPDLNNNAKPDDPGENQPTPFVVLTTAEMPPCDSLNKILYKQTFGTGNGRVTAIPAVSGISGTATTDYTGTTAQPVNVEEYTISNNANNGHTTNWISLSDHTGGNGRMMLVNADVKSNKIYSHKIPISCGNLKYSLFAFVSNIANSTYEDFCGAFGGIVKPKLTFTVKDSASGLIITTLTTPEITSPNWTQYGMKFVMPATVNGNPVTKIIIEISNAAAGGCGNDLAIDDIQFGLCDPMPTVSVNNSAGCTNGITTFSAALNDPTVISGPLEYQWQRSNNGTSGWTDIPGANSVDYTISPLQPSDIGKYYRVIVAAAGNIGNASCRYTSTAFQLTAKTSSTAPTGIDASPAQTTCPGNAVDLTVQGGSLGTNAVWRWYRNSCGDTLIGTGNTISVLPTQTTTYYVRAEGDCNTTTCAQVTIVVDPCVILPVDFLQFSAVQRAYAIDLDWKIITSEQISHFEVERSGDGNHFKKIGVVNGGSAKNTAARFSYQDADPDVNSNIIYYRIKVVSINGVSKYSNTLTVRISALNNTKLKISPNPASSSVNISFYSALRGTMELQLLDMTGKIVLREQRVAESGQNSITLNQLSGLSEGIYTILVRTGDRWERERIIIKR